MNKVDIVLPPRPGERRKDELDNDEELDFSDVPIRIEIQEDVYDMSFGEAMDLLSLLSTQMGLWWKLNGRT